MLITTGQNAGTGIRNYTMCCQTASSAIFFGWLTSGLFSDIIWNQQMTVTSASGLQCHIYDSVDLSVLHFFAIEFSQKNCGFVGVGKRFFDCIKKSFTHPTWIATFGGPTSVGKILDKSRPPERRWGYPKPQRFPENSITACFTIIPDHQQ